MTSVLSACATLLNCRKTARMRQSMTATQLHVFWTSCSRTDGRTLMRACGGTMTCQKTWPLYTYELCNIPISALLIWLFFSNCAQQLLPPLDLLTLQQLGHFTAPYPQGHHSRCLTASTTATIDGLLPPLTTPCSWSPAPMVDCINHGLIQ